jgi:membrane protein implicated in regulation of membrane protease activity
MKDSIWDLITLAAALPSQYLLYIVWMAIVMQAWIVFGVSSTIVVVLSVVLYFTWLRRLNYQSLNKRQVEYKDEDESMPVELEDVTADTETMVEDQK